MILVDLNLLIYATNQDSPDHLKAKTWWESSLNGEEPVGLAWIVLLGFLRLTTNPRIMPAPLSTVQAFEIIQSWLDQPVLRLVDAGPRQWEIFRELVGAAGAAGNLTTDAFLAALALENDATLCSADNDFARFRSLRYQNPLV